MGLFKIVLSILLLFIASKIYAQEKAITDSSSIDTSIFKRVEIEAGFPGGAEGWRKFLERNLNAQVPSNNGAPVGMGCTGYLFSLW